MITNHPLVNIYRKELTVIPDGPTIIASGPLTSPALSAAIADFVDKDFLYFYDAVAPIIIKDSIDFSVAYYKSRYDKGGNDYINLPMDQITFLNFYNELINANTIKFHDFEDEVFFEGCMPIEEMAKRGMKTLLFGPLNPVGLSTDEHRKPYAVVH